MFLNHFRSISYLILVILVNFENNSFQNNNLPTIPHLKRAVDQFNLIYANHVIYMINEKLTNIYCHVNTLDRFLT